jgi:hypothetical protein
MAVNLGQLLVDFIGLQATPVNIAGAVQTCKSGVRSNIQTFQALIWLAQAGGCPAASPFLFFAQEKGTKEKGTPLRRSFGLPSICRSIRAAAELALCAQTVLAEIPRLDRHIEAVQEGNCAASIVYVENPVLVWVFSVCSVFSVAGIF